MSNQASSWADLVGLHTRYQRSVHLERDAHSESALDGYVITPLVRSVTRRVAAGLGKEATARSWSLTGPYGSGKSAYAVFLTRVLSIPDDAASKAGRKLLAQHDKEADKQLFGRGSLLGRKGGLCPVIATGERRPLDQVLLEALEVAVEDFWSGPGKKPAVLGKISKALKRSTSKGPLAASELVDLFEEVAEKIEGSAQDGHGLLVILDEAGKILEYAAENPEQGDIQLLQELAEAANRSGDTPIVFAVLLHQAFEQYAGRLSVAQRNEWAKVQGRFEDVIFQEAPDQVLRLISTALDRQPLPKKLETRATKLAKAVAKTTKLSSEVSDLAELLASSAPLHPVAAMTLGPLFRSRFCQNERSLFAFLASNEPFGFQEFLRDEEQWEAVRFFTIDRLYDYVLNTFGGRLYGQQGRQWAQIEETLRRLPADARDVDARLVRVIGLLGLLGESCDLVPSEQVLIAALDGTATASQVRESLKRLKAVSIVVFRKYKNAFQLWEGSDLNIEDLLQQALGELDATASIAPRLRKIVRPRPLVARRHLFETGTLRYFQILYADENSLGAEIPPPNGDADGVVWVAIPTTNQETESLRRRLPERMAWMAHDETIRPAIVVVPNNVAQLRERGLELAALEWIQAHTPELESDVVARRELTGRMAEVERLLREQLTAVLAGQAPSEWYYRGDRLDVASSRDLARVISDICDQAYAKAPIIHNELLNRRNISSSAAAARRNLLDAMAQHSHEERLGIEGSPPELSMYRSVLEFHGLHRNTDDGWRFTAPKRKKQGSLKPAYEAVLSALRDSERTRIAIPELYKKLQEPPFGIKDGVLPVLLTEILLEYEAEIAVYENETFVPALTLPVIERLLRSADKFELQRFEIAGSRMDVLKGLYALFYESESPEQASLLKIVRQLVRFVAELPNYTKNTKSVSETAQNVRETLLRAKEPGRLVFTDLPRACGLDPIAAGTSKKDIPKELVSRLRGALRELNLAYGHLLDTVSQELNAAFGLPTDPVQSRKELKERAEQLLQGAADLQLKGFLLRVSDDALTRDDWLISIATLLAGKPPEFWYDQDLEKARLQLGQTHKKFAALEAIMIDRFQGSLEEGTQLLRLAVTQPGLPDSERVVAVRADDLSMLERFREEVEKVIESNAASLPREALLAGLGQIAQQMMSELEPDTEARKEQRTNGR